MGNLHLIGDKRTCDASCSPGKHISLRKRPCVVNWRPRSVRTRLVQMYTQFSNALATYRFRDARLLNPLRSCGVRRGHSGDLICALSSIIPSSFNPGRLTQRHTLHCSHKPFVACSCTVRVPCPSRSSSTTPSLLRPAPGRWFESRKD